MNVDSLLQTVYQPVFNVCKHVDPEEGVASPVDYTDVRSELIQEKCAFSIVANATLQFASNKSRPVS